ncbi:MULTISPECIES: hypothetical protein [unclassified Lysobacter]|uniref:hypothetical protein n=1 Tax=unclassified Lysobacter TaxID=2635362 RepID=UPI001BE4F716|nr:MULTISPECIES: hypothetical protein [unclassified Lysobacter]MBT2750012.1 hypothetical protein [Lysobacter sp. ISL-50]MBT2775416.1 hypothetical protein [Lysobacter sp. ISL-54]MBT2783539.1 hypothetical protein [Lysobacter sp. ISL-52]
MSFTFRPAIFGSVSLRQWQWSLLIPLLTACTTTGRATVTTSGCEWTRPILVSRLDQLTDLTARQILAHNETGRRLCGWGAKAARKQP